MKGNRGFQEGHKINLGRKLSKKTRKKMSLAKKGKPSSKGMLGKHHTKETKERISKFQKGRPKPKGKDSPNWRGGTEYSMNWTETLKRSIRERDNYICQKCSQYGNNVHHIDYDKKNCDPKNLITLCRKCNNKVNFKRKYWTEYFKKLIKLLEQKYGSS